MSKRLSLETGEPLKELSPTINVIFEGLISDRWEELVTEGASHGLNPR